MTKPTSTSKKLRKQHTPEFRDEALKLAREGRKMSSRDLTLFSAARRHAIVVCVLEEVSDRRSD